MCCMYITICFQIAASLLFVLSPQVHSSGVIAPHVAASAVPVTPALRYRLVAPQNIRPFAAQVSTFSRGLNVFAAPYAAGVLSGPAVIPRALIPGIPPVPKVPVAAAPAVAPIPAAPFAPLPGFGPTPSFPAPVAPVYAGFSPASALPAVPYPAPAYPVFGAVPASPVAAPLAPIAPVAPIGVPASLLPGPFHRSVHAVSPQVGPVPPHAALLG